MYPIGKGLSLGVPNLAGALVFAIIALQQYGPQHFFYLSFWWVLGVIVIYGLTLCLGTEVLRQYVARHFAVAQIGLVSSATLVVTVLSAAAFLGEPLHPATIASMLLVLAGVSLRFLLPRPQTS
jgi:drug/metabolite transporter (DMT)-like permease